MTKGRVVWQVRAIGDRTAVKRLELCASSTDSSDEPPIRSHHFDRVWMACDQLDAIAGSVASPY